jgi:hypothetical protein
VLQLVAAHPLHEGAPPPIGAEEPSDPLEKEANTETSFLPPVPQFGQGDSASDWLKERIFSNLVSHCGHLYS